MSQTQTEIPFDLDEAINNLVTEDDEPVDNTLSEKQQRLLVEPLYTSWTPPPDEDEPEQPCKFWAAANLGVFPSVNQPPPVPDVFLSLDVESPADPHEKRGRAYFVWDYGKPPEVALEIVSNRKGGEMSRKLKDYARIGVTYYVVYDPKCELSERALSVYEIGFGKRYRLRDDYQLPAVGLSLTLWRGLYEGREYEWLRWCDATGSLIPTGAEGRRAEAERAEREAQARAQAEEQAARLAAKLRELGVDPTKL